MSLSQEFLKDHERERALKTVQKWKGALKGQGKFKTEQEFHDWRSNEGGKELMDYFKKKHGIID